MERLKISGIPGPLIYELLAYHACKAGKMDSTMRILKNMFLAHLTPRITMHTAFIKRYFYVGRIEDVCKYVSNMSTRGQTLRADTPQTGTTTFSPSCCGVQ
jgi:hypothetical protein